MKIDTLKFNNTTTKNLNIKLEILLIFQNKIKKKEFMTIEEYSGRKK